MNTEFNNFALTDFKRRQCDSFINGYKEFKARSEDYDDFYQKITLFIQLMQEKNILSETRLSELNEWQQISEIQFQLDWLENFKKQYIN